MSLISAIGSLGSANDKNAGTDTVSITPSRAVAKGRLVVVWVAWDSVFSIFSPSEAPYSYYVSDTAGNIYTNISAKTDRQAFFASGAWSGIFVSQLRAALSTSDTITVGSGQIGTLIAKAMSVQEFDLGGNRRWAMNRTGAAKVETRGAPPATVPLDMELEQEWLELHVLGNEGPSSDSFTWDPDWTQIIAAGTTGGAADSNVTVLGGYRIATEATTSVAVANVTANRDNTQGVVAICAIRRSSFPHTPILDTFNRANEYPLDGGLWGTTNEAYGSAFATLTSNAATGGGGSFYNEVWNECAEAYCTITTFSGGVPLLHIMATGDTTVPNMVGTGAAWKTFAGWFSVGDVDVITFGRSGNQGDVDDDFAQVWANGVNNVKWGLQRTMPHGAAGGGAGATRLWLDLGSGWEQVAAIFLSGGTTNTSGKAAIGATSSPPFMDNFGGGQIRCQRPARIIRYVSN